MLILTLLIALETPPAEIAPLEQEKPEKPTLIDEKPAPKETGKFGGLIGAATGCAAGTGAPGALLGGGAGFLSYLYGQAAVGACVGWGPALVAMGTATGMCGAAVCLPPLAASGTVAGAMYGAQQDGRDPMAALWGGMPGLVLAGLSTGAMITGFALGTFLGLTSLGPAAIVILVGAGAGILSIPCTMLGSSITDVVVAHMPPEKPPEPLAGAGKPTDSATMKY